MGQGIIVQVDAPTGTATGLPTGFIHVVPAGGTGELKYEGYNSHHLHPVGPGSPVRFQVFLLPTKPGPVNVKVEFVMADKSTKTVPFAFNIAP